ncbi:MAG: hypothetical protein ACRCY4_03060 [Brevinema sp.]
MISNVLRRLLFLPWRSKLVRIIFFAFIASFFLLGANLVLGADIQARNSLVQNYSGHALIRTDIYTPISPNDPVTWWTNTFNLQQLGLNPYVRGFSRRTKLPSFLVQGAKRIPVDLILIEDSDGQVFPPFMTPSEGLATDMVSIGIGMSARHALEEDTLIDISIPALSTVLTNQRIRLVYNVRDVYFQNFTVFMNQRTVNSLIGESMRSYHVHYTASPFSPLLISNTQPLVPNSRFVSSIDELEYSIEILRMLKTILFAGLISIFILAGVFYAFAQYRYAIKTKASFQDYCAIHGFQIPPTHRYRLFDLFRSGLLMGIFATIFSLIFQYLPFEFLIFSPYSGLFPQFSLRVSQGIVPQMDGFFAAQGVLAGIFAFIGSVYVASAVFSYFESRSKDFGPLITAMLLGALISFLYSAPLFFNLYARQARNNEIRQHFFGQYLFQNQFRPQSLSSGSSPPMLMLRPSTIAQLNANNIPYLLKLEAAGEIIQIAKINEEVSSTNRREVNFLGLRGSALPEMQALITRLESNQLIVGKDIGEQYKDIELLSFVLYGQESNISVSLPLSSVETFDISLYNNTVFMNIDTLAAYLGAGQGGITSLLTPDSAALEYLPTLPTPENEEIVPFSVSSKWWTPLEAPVFSLLWIVHLIGMAIASSLIMASFYVSFAHDSDEHLYGMYWSRPKNFLSSFMTVGSSLLAGIFFATAYMVPFIVSRSPLPNFLQLGQYTSAVAAFRIDVLGIIFVYLGAIILLFINYLSAHLMLKSLYVRFFHHPEDMESSYRIKW